MRYIGKIDISIYKCITEDIATDEVIITDERIAHIKERHPDAYEEVAPFLSEALKNPDYILEDKRFKDTRLILKEIVHNELRMQIILKIQTSTDNVDFKNSIISAWQISENRWKNYLNNRKVLYKQK